eukprot:scaffold109_cov252-Pinguiococcus_pyrenoidosus.AAC.2
MLGLEQEASFWAAAAARGLEFWSEAMDLNDGMDVECDQDAMESAGPSFKRQRPDELPLHQQVKRLCLKRTLSEDMSKKRPRPGADLERHEEQKHQKTSRTQEKEELTRRLR